MGLKSKTIDLGYYLYNPDIWDTPFKKPDNIYLGIHGQSIPREQIPFDWKIFSRGRGVIENEYGEELYFDEGSYRLLTDNKDVFLANWFTTWTLVYKLK